MSRDGEVAPEHCFGPLLDALDQGAWIVSGDGRRTLYANRALAAIYGRTVAQILEHPDLWLDVVHPEDRPRIAATAHTLRAEGRVSSEYRVLRPDGEVRWVLEQKVLLRDSSGTPRCMGGTLLDISERKQTEIELEQTRRRAQQYLDVAEVMLLALDTEGRIEMLNPKGYQVLGHPLGSLQGADWFATCLPEDMRETARKRFAALLAGEVEVHVYAENEVLTGSGRRRLIAWHNALIYDRHGHICGTLSSGTDISEQRAAEAETHHLQRQLAQAQKLEALGRLSSGIAHDFNNILASVLGFASLALDRYAGQCPPKVVDYLREVRSAGERARDLVAQLLHFGRGQGGEAQPLALAPLIKEVVKMLHASLTPAIQFQLDLDPEVPPVEMAPVEVHQILVNLCMNASDALGGQGTIGIGLRRWQGPDAECALCHQRMSGAWVELVVSDSGCGIEPATLGRIFDPFFTTKAPGKGSGMGLAVIRNILEDRGAHLLVESQPRIGSRFRILFPPAPGGSLRQDMGSPLRFQAALRGRILVVDDEAAVGFWLGDLLRMHGCQVEVERDARTALERFERAPRAFDLVITDLTMPGLSGLDLAARLRALRPDLALILCSGRHDAPDPERARTLGIRHLLPKPVAAGDLLGAVAEVLGRG